MGISTRHRGTRTVIGIDAATQPKNIGLALGSIRTKGSQIDEVATASTMANVVSTVAGWCTESTLVAIDAPLGWPVGFGGVLAEHRAGDEIAAPANQIFRRRTDDEIHSILGKRPLDVGSNLIARTAHSALMLLGRLRQQLDQPIPLAWEPDSDHTVRAIEVYPAATLISRRLSDRGYKRGKSDAVHARESILSSLSREVRIEESIGEHARDSDHVLDGILCVLAGFDFLGGFAIPPEDPDLARREGWIWTRGAE